MAHTLPGAGHHRRVLSESAVAYSWRGYEELGASAEGEEPRGSSRPPLTVFAPAPTPDPPLMALVTPRNTPREILRHSSVPEDGLLDDVSPPPPHSPLSEETLVTIDLFSPPQLAIAPPPTLLRQMLRADAAAHKRVLSSIVLPRDIFRATMLLLASLLLLTPLLFGQALTGDALWWPFARPGTYLNVVVVRAQGLPPRETGGPEARAGAATRSALSGPPQGASSSSDSSASAAARNVYVRVTTWPWEDTRGQIYFTVPVNGTLAPVWGDGGESFTFQQESSRAKKIVLQLHDALPDGSAPVIGVALLPTPPRGSPAVSVLQRNEMAQALQSSGGPLHAGWFALRPPAEVGAHEYSSTSSEEGWTGGAQNATAASAFQLGAIFAAVSFATRLEQSSYCEAIRENQPVAQPVDSYSNAFFLLTGLHMCAVGLADWRLLRAQGRGAGHPALSGMQHFPVFSFANGLVQIFAGASSFLFHASMTEVGHALDMVGVYQLLVSPILYAAMRLGAWGAPAGRAAAAALLAAQVLAAFLMYRFKYGLETRLGGSTNTVLCLVALLMLATASWLWLLGGPVITLPPPSAAAPPAAIARSASGRGGGGGGGWPGLPLRRRPSSIADAEAAAADVASSAQPPDAPDSPPAPHTPRPPLPLPSLQPRELPRGLSYRWALASLAAIGVAYGSRVADLTDSAVCQPHGLFQLHAVWHAFAALSLWSLWTFLRSEEASWAASAAAGAKEAPTAPPSAEEEVGEEPPSPPPPARAASPPTSPLLSPRSMLSPRPPGAGHTRSASLLAAAAAAAAALGGGGAGGGWEPLPQSTEAEAEAGARGQGGATNISAAHARTRSRGGEAFAQLAEAGGGVFL